MVLSVIIPTRDRASLLRGTLESLAKQTYPSDMFEVIVVDNGSTDDTKATCELYNSQMNLRYFYDATPGLHVGRHLGMVKANADILVYGDDDIEAFPSWLEAIRAAFEDEEVVLVCGKSLPRFESTPPHWFDDLWFETPWGVANGYFSLIDFGDEVKEISPGYVWGCNFSIRKGVLQQIGGFHPDGMPKEMLRFRGDGESAVGAAIRGQGLKTLYHPQASVFHSVPRSRMTLDYLYHRSYIQGISDSFTAIRRKKCAQGEPTSLSLLTSMVNRMARKTSRFRTRHLRKPDLVRDITSKGWQDGYAFHQGQVQEDKFLLQWVMLQNYLDGSRSAFYYNQWQTSKPVPVHTRDGRYTNG